MKILIIDGNENRRKTISQTLSHLGYEPTFTKNNSDLLETIKNITFDVILIDATLPVEDMEGKINLIKNYGQNSFIIALESTTPGVKNNIELIKKTSAK